jgi:hypothetical protein
LIEQVQERQLQRKNFMDSRDIINHAMNVMVEVQRISAEMDRLAKLNDAEGNLWTVAVTDKNGTAEHEHRAKLHNYLDQLLDLRARSLQLVNDLQNLPAPKL